VWDGKGELKWTSGGAWNGQIVKGKFTGFGTYTYAPNMITKTGMFKDGTLVCDQRKVIVKQVDGYTYTGPLKNCQYHGKASVKWGNGQTYDGSYDQGKRTG